MQANQRADMQATCYLVMAERDWAVMNSQRVQNQSRDVLVKLAGYAALTSASVVVLRAVLVTTFNAKLTDPSNQDLAPAYQCVPAPRAVGWVLLRDKCRQGGCRRRHLE